jgi:drug/metabolite transporter (DMT)-like permease
MYWLFIATLFSFGFVQLFKGSQRRGEYAPVVVTANYITLSLALGTYLVLTGHWAVDANILKVGISIGITFISAMLMMTHALTIAGVSPVVTAFRLSMLLPVALGVWIWSEPISFLQLVGIALAIIALALMTHHSPSAQHKHGTKVFIVILIVFLIQGIAMTCMRWVHYAGLDAQRLNVLMFIGTTAGLLGSIFVLMRRKPIQKKDVQVGVGIGLYNAIALSITLTALSMFPGTIYFPVVGCSVVLLDNLFAHFYWKERLARPAMAGVGLAFFAIILVM